MTPLINYRLMGGVLSTITSAVVMGFGKQSSTVPVEHATVVREFGEDALRTFSAIEPQFQRLGLNEPVGYTKLLDAGEPKYITSDEWRLYRDAENFTQTYAFLEDCVTYWGRDVLPEFLEVGGELKPGEQLAYFDGLQDTLPARVDYIASLQLDDRTREFGKEVAAAKIQSLEMTLKGMDNPEAWYNAPSNRQLVEDQLARLRPIVEVG